MNYLKYLSKLGDIITDEGETVEVFELQDDIDTFSFDNWAHHFRQQYCSDDIIDALVKGSGLSKESFLLKFKFPDEKNDFGPSTRSGDFGELLVSDYLEFFLGYNVPRERYKNKFNRNSSTQGTDVIAYRILDEKYNPKDELITFEVKTQASRCISQNRLQDAINDSYKDEIRKGETLNALKQLYLEKGKINESLIMERFQNKPDHPYIEKYGAAAVQDTIFYSEDVIKSAKISGGKRMLIVIKRNNLMRLVHELYRRAAKC